MEASSAFYGEIKFPELSFVNYQNWIYIPQNRIVEVDNNFQFQQLSRGLESRDYNLLISNMSYVSKWSMIQMLIVIICGVVQVYFVKKLFQDPRQGQGKAKARI